MRRIIRIFFSEESLGSLEINLDSLLPLVMLEEGVNGNGWWFLLTLVYISEGVIQLLNSVALIFGWVYEYQKIIPFPFCKTWERKAPPSSKIILLHANIKYKVFKSC
jgi:hypothetical protein